MRLRDCGEIRKNVEIRQVRSWEEVESLKDVVARCTLDSCGMKRLGKRKNKGSERWIEETEKDIRK